MVNFCSYAKISQKGYNYLKEFLNDLHNIVDLIQGCTVEDPIGALDNFLDEVKVV